MFIYLAVAEESVKDFILLTSLSTGWGLACNKENIVSFLFLKVRGMREGWGGRS